MAKISTQKQIYGYFLFVLILCFLSFFRFQTQIQNYLAEKMFLSFHKDTIAIKILESLPEKRKDFYTYYLLGRLYFVENSLPTSIQDFTKSTELNPNFKEAFYGRGLAYGFMSPIFYPDAENDFKKYIEIDNAEFSQTGFHAYGAWAGYNDLAWIYFLEQNYDDAEKTAIQGMQISQYNPWLSNMLGVVQLKKHDCKDANINLDNAKVLLQSINSQQFGQAYSGDNPDFWKIGKDQMQKTIQENLKLCQNATSTFPQ